MTFSSLIFHQFLRSVTHKITILPLTSFPPTFSVYLSSLPAFKPDQNGGSSIESEHKLVSDILHKKCGFSQSSLPVGFKKSRSVCFPKTIQFSDRSEQAISFLKGLGIKEDALRKMILGHPSILSYKVEKMIAKVNYFETLGMDRVNFIKMLSVQPRILTAKLNSTLIPKITYFKGILRTEKDLIQVLTRQPSILFQKLEGRLKPCIEFLQNSGIREKELSSLIVHSPRIIMRNASNSLVKKVNYVEKLGFKRGSKMFMHALMAVDCMSEETLEAKVKNLKSFGLLDHEISRLVRTSPAILTLSTERVQRTMDFVLNTLRLPANTVASTSVLLTCNLETRIKARLRVLDRLKMMSLLSKDYSIRTVVGMPEKQFLDKFVDCYSRSEELHLIYKGVDDVGMKEFLET